MTLTDDQFRTVVSALCMPLATMTAANGRAIDPVKKSIENAILIADALILAVKENQPKPPKPRAVP